MSELPPPDYRERWSRMGADWCREGLPLEEVWARIQEDPDIGPWVMLGLGFNLGARTLDDPGEN